MKLELTCLAARLIGRRWRTHSALAIEGKFVNRAARYVIKTVRLCCSCELTVF
jgi:hypothetical protein